MNRRLLCTSTLFLLLGGALRPATGEPKLGRDPSPATLAEAADKAVASTSGFVPIRQFQGNLTLARAVEIALHQNPDILTALQEIQRTRGLIIEVRAAALPQITLTGDYDQQDKRLLRGGGFTGGGSSSTATSVSTASLQSTAPSTSQTSSGFVGNTNTAGTGLDTTNSGTTSSSGLTATRGQRHPADTPVTSTGSGTTTTSSSSDNSDLASEIQQAIGANSSERNGQDKTWNVVLEVRQVLYAGGQLTAAIRIAKLTQDSTYYALRDVVDRVVAQVREQFFTVLVNRALITVQEEAVRLAEEQLQDQKNRYEAGTVPKFNVLRAEVEVFNVRPILFRARNDFLLARIQLAKDLGISPGKNGQPEFNCIGDLGLTKRRLSLPDALALARARRPFLKVQRLSILVDVQDVKVELAGYKPRLDAQAGYELRNRSPGDELSDVANGWFFGVAGSWAIFDGFQTYGRVKQARARLEQSKIHYDDSVREVELEVQSAYANLEEARQTIESQQKNVEEAEEALRLSRERFSAGAGTQLEVLDARVALTRSRTTELQARGDYNRDLAEFDRATATETVYHEDFHDPLHKVEKGIFARIAETGLPKSPEPEPEPGEARPSDVKPGEAKPSEPAR